jgi:dolichyl-phosphate beta-glucosyltransferase
LSIIIPAYNEAQRLPKYLAEVVSYITEKFGSAAEILVVDDGSLDATAVVSMEAGRDSGLVKVIRLDHNRGKGYAVKTGMLAAKGELRLFTDADGATPIEELGKLLLAIDAGADIVVASRALQDDSRSVNSRWSRRIMGTCYNLLVRSLAVPGIFDTQCGFKLFRGEVADRLFTQQRIPGFGFDPEVLFLAHKMSCRIVEVPVNWQDVAGSKVNVIRDSARMFSDLFTIRMHWYTGAYTQSGSVRKYM